MHESDIFLHARKLPLHERDQYLADACGSDNAMRADVEELLAADVCDEPATSESPNHLSDTITIPAGTIFARRYQLLEKLGEGGMGMVYVADQLEPVQRRVAIKIVPSRFASSSTLARFEQERQALALMDHPNIAKVFDAGLAEDSGQPYFIMEYIQGVPITDYCRTANLTLTQRVELFIPVCQAIQHAHQKGIIHRDLKPSNILVGACDGKPIPKVIDFGVAKVMENKLIQRSICTEAGALIGTLEYMSPEQAELSNLDIDTRTDIYALGVILYELLTGTVPFNRKVLERVGLGEMLRVIKEVDPPRPSTRLSNSHAQAQASSPRPKLTKLVQGDLDCIVLKAIEKDRTRRYETADGLAQDLQRYLADEPLLARPPSAGYRLRKLVKKHRGKVLAAAMLFVVLLCGIVGTTWGLIEANRQREIAEANAAAAKQSASLAAQNEAKANRAAGEERLAKEKAQTAEKKSAQRLAQIREEQKKTREQVQITRAVRDFFLNDVIRQADSGNQLKLGQEANPDLTVKEALKRASASIDGKFDGQGQIDVAVRLALGETLIAVGEYRAAIPHFEHALAVREKHYGTDHPSTRASWSLLLQAYLKAGEYDRVIGLLEKHLDSESLTFRSGSPFSERDLNALGIAYSKKGLHDKALALQSHLRKINTEKRGADHVQTLGTLHNLAVVLRDINQYPDAISLLEQAYLGSAQKLGPEHPFTLVILTTLASCYHQMGQYDEAIRLYERARITQTKILGPDHPNTLRTTSSLAQAYHDVQKTEVAIPLLEQVEKEMRRKLGPEHSDTVMTMERLATCYSAAGQLEKASILLEKINACKQKKPESHVGGPIP